MIPVLTPTDAAARLDELWSPRVLAAVDDTLVKVAKVHGSLTWHSHADEDELLRAHPRYTATALAHMLERCHAVALIRLASREVLFCFGAICLVSGAVAVFEQVDHDDRTFGTVFDHRLHLRRCRHHRCI